MSFLLPCPHCGPRGVYEFRFGGEVKQRPTPDAPKERWVDYIYTKTNEAGVQKEWWYHRDGCRQWMLVLRNTVSNQILEAFFPEETP